MKKITIIGGSGFVGTRLMDYLKDDSNYKLHNIDLLPSQFFPQFTELGDVRSQEDLDRMLKGTDIVVLLAAQHRDDVEPTSLYYETNVEGMKVTLRAMEKNGVKRMLFFSSVSVYGLNKNNPNEDHPKDPFNHYGKSKVQAEKVLTEWCETHRDWNINIVRPTVLFGERNRGNVYNLLSQIQNGHFLMVGKGTNVKSMAYVGNIVAFVKFMIETMEDGYNVYNYVDKPDINMNEMVELVGQVLGKHIPHIHFPYWLGMLGGKCFDLVAMISRKKLSISSVRVKKFCATTQFDATKAMSTGFVPPYTLKDGLIRTLEFEFLHPRKDAIEFVSE